MRLVKERTAAGRGTDMKVMIALITCEAMGSDPISQNSALVPVVAFSKPWKIAETKHMMDSRLKLTIMLKLVPPSILLRFGQDHGSDGWFTLRHPPLSFVAAELLTWTSNCHASSLLPQP